jgi:hypothetical protein
MSAISEWTKSPTNANELHADASTGSHLVLSQRKDKYFDLMIDGLKKNSQRMTRQAAVQFAEAYVERLAKAEQEGKEAAERVFAVPPHQRKAAMEKEAMRFVDEYFARPITERSEAINSIAVLAQEEQSTVAVAEEPVLEIPTDGLASPLPAELPMYLGQPRITFTEEPLTMTAEEPQEPSKRSKKGVQRSSKVKQEATESSKQATPKKDAPKEAKPKTGVDRFGCLEGKPPARINSILDNEPRTVEQIAQLSGLTTGRVREHLNYWKRAGRALGAVLRSTEEGKWFIVS